ncbi:hypothetical protein PUN28_011916 [Cardiocondyla obscurior]|uniref:Uncharacterized protein n=1 Tax=Cardiocondyla obscurior TaxID=286306 RepID=A0AAW2FLT5_9HYME
MHTVLSPPEAEKLTKNIKKFFKNLKTYHCAVTSADAHVTIFSRLTSTRSRDIEKTKIKFLKSDAHVTIFSDLHSPRAEILTKKKF